MSPFVINILLFVGVALYILICGFLILIVLVQEGKSGGFGSEGGGQSPEVLSQSFGAGGSQKVLFRATSIVAGIFFVIAIGLTIIGEQKERAGGALDLRDAPPEAGAVMTVPETRTVTESAPSDAATE